MSKRPDEISPPAKNGGWRAAVVLALQEHRALLALVAAYIAIAYAIQFSFGFDGMIHLKFGYRYYSIFTLLSSLIFLGVQRLRGRIRTYLNIQHIAGMLLIGVLAPMFMSVFSSLKQVLPGLGEYAWDPFFMKLDYALHLGHHPWELTRPLLNHPVLLHAVDGLYLAWFPLLFAMSVWMGWSSRRQLRRRFFLCACLIWILMGTLLATVLSSAGPCYYDKVTAVDLNPYEPHMHELLTHHKSAGLYALANQHGVWKALEQNRWVPFGGVSAMPSLHVALAVLVALVTSRVNRWLGAAGWLYVLVTQLGSVLLVWHYAIDGYLSVVLVLLLWKAVGAFVPETDPT